MIYAYVDGQRRQRQLKGERTSCCRDCGALLRAVMPVQNTAHWRHKLGDCDPWCEPEGPWHLGWKERFDPAFREIGLRDRATGELHRAGIFCNSEEPNATVLELQHSPIPEAERIAREAFYLRDRRMLWLVHIHNDQLFLGYNLAFSLNFYCDFLMPGGRRYDVMHGMGRSKQLIEKWKRAEAHVFFDMGRPIFHLAQGLFLLKHGCNLKAGEFGLSELTPHEFILAVQRESASDD